MSRRSIKRIFGAIFLLVAFWGVTNFLFFDNNGQVASAQVVVEQKEIVDEQFNMKVINPQITGSEYKKSQAFFNKVLNNYVDSRVESYKERFQDAAKVGMKANFSSEYEVTFNSADLICISFTGSQYTGGAHGIYWRNSFTMDLVTEKQYSLLDLFKNPSSAKVFIDAKIQEEINKDKTTAEFIAFNGIDKATGFYITNESVVIYYQLYDITSYALGMPTYEISFEQLRPYFAKQIEAKLFKQ